MESLYDHCILQLFVLSYTYMKNNEQNVILDSISEGVFTVDLDWRITSFNRAAEEISGIKRHEAIGRH